MARRAALGVMFPCSPAGSWVLCVGLHPLVHLLSGLWEREVRQKDRSVSGSPVPPMCGCASSGFAGSPPGQGWLPGVVAAYGWSNSRCFDTHRRDFCWGEAFPGVRRCVAISGWQPWGLCHVCAAVCRLILAAVPLRPVWCPSTAGDRLQRAEHAFAVFGGARRSRWCRLACSWGRVPGFGSRWIRALGGSPDLAQGRCRGH